MESEYSSVNKWLEWAETHIMQGNHREAYNCLNKARELARERNLDIRDKIANIERIMKDVLRSKQEILKRFVSLFGELLTETNPRRQTALGKEIAHIAREALEEERSDPDEDLRLISQACLSMEHWKDQTRFCHLTEQDIKDYMKKVQRMMIGI